jgi:hypothetical protein
MKSLAVTLLVALSVLGVAIVADAQSGSSPGAQAPSSTSTPSGGSGPASTPGGEMKSETRSSDDPAALPRAATGDRTTIFGLSPTAAVVIAAALLVVVILAIIAMTRSNDTYIER